MIRVMIVEDQKLVRSLLESYIQNEYGYQLAVLSPAPQRLPSCAIPRTSTLC